MIRIKALIFIALSGMLFANNCPKFAPITINGFLMMIPIYPYVTTATDQDCDGLSDSYEKSYGTNLNKRDTDGDGVGDYEDDYPLNLHKSEDTTAPRIHVKGRSTIILNRNSKYKEEGATAIDDRDGVVSVRIIGHVNTSVSGIYSITYQAVDMKGNKSVKYRKVSVGNVCSKYAPILMDDITVIIPIYNGNNTAPDQDCDGLSDTYEREYGTDSSNSDTDGDGADDYRDDYPLNPHKSVDKTAPVITLKGKVTVVLYRYYTYKEAGASAKDDRDGTLKVRIIGKVNTSVPKTYRIAYHAVDARGNKSVKYRTVIVKTQVKPLVVVDTISPKDATGYRPSNIVEQFIKAFLANDKNKVSELVGGNKQLLDILYKNAKATAFLKRIYKNTYNIKGGQQKMGDASVTITFRDNGAHKGGFELMKSGVGNKWIIRQIY